MVPAENKATCFSLFINTAKKIQFISHFRPMLPYYTTWEYQPDPLFIVHWWLCLSFFVACLIDVLERLYFQQVWRIFFLKWTYLKVLAWRYKVSILPSKFRESSSADSPFAELRRWEKREQILEFIMNEETIWCTSIFYFFFETDLKKTVNNTIRIVGWWIWRVFFC